MEQKTATHNFSFNAFDLIQFMWDRKWILMAVSALAFIASAIVSLTITPKFKSQVVLFPAASVSLAKNLVETYSFSMDGRDIMTFGGDDDAERLLQILHSKQIMDHITAKFDLMKHYEIDSTSPYPQTLLHGKYKGNVKFRRTEYMSVEIDVFDTDPQMAADIANAIAAYIDSTYHTMQRARALEAFGIVEKEYLGAQAAIALLNDSLQRLRKLGVFDYESQAASLNAAYAEALVQGRNSAAETIQKKLNTLSTYGGIYVELSQKLESEIERLAQLKSKHASYKIYIEHSMPHIFVVDKAFKAERKAIPRRSVIVIITTLSVFAMTLLLLIVLENIRIRK